LSKRKNRDFSDKEVLMARLFCVALGGFVAFVGMKLVGGETSVPPAIAWIAAAIGLVAMLFGLLAPRQKCVSTAGFVLGLFF
jgi:hypothetical protein